MNALTQYINLFSENRALFDGRTAPAIRDLHDRALKALENAELPSTKTEGYAKTSVNDMFSPDFGININRLNFPTDLAQTFRCDVPNLSTLLGIVINDLFVPTTTLRKNLNDGVTVCSLSEAAEKMPEKVTGFLGSAAPMDNAGVAINSLLMQDGVFIYVPKNTVVEHPIQIVNIFSAPAPLLAARRVLVVLEEGARCSILMCDHTQNKDMDFLASEVVEIIAGKDSVLDYVALEESSVKTSRFSQCYVNQETGSDVNINSTTLFNGNTRNEFTVNINGEHAVSELTGMVIADKNRHVDNYSNICHNAPKSKSNQLFKYLVDDNATCAFEGGIYVDEKAPFTEGYQNNRNILASENARMYSKPQLLIYNDEVKCSHGAATGQLDEKQLFYMQTRGIPMATAKQLLMQAFMTDAIAKIRIEPIRSRLAHLIEKRISGESSLCSSGCSTGCHSKQETELC